MVIELLRFHVAPELREQYIQVDAEVWTPFLASYSGFLSKEVWINPNNAAEVIFVIHWASREAWKSIPGDRLEAVEKQFADRFGHSYNMVESSEYQVRKFRQSTAD
jgi:uncharacterized protein (TIGR03792 family)